MICHPSTRDLAAPLLTALALCLSACDGGATGGDPPDAGTPPPPPPPAPEPDPAPPPPAATPPEEAAPPVEHEPLAARQVVEVPAGVVRLGSRPGTDGRNARAEADLVPVEVPAFTIDRLPYPNDPDQPPRTNVTQAEAANLCQERGQRLCTGIEWERACKGDSLARYPGGDTYDYAACAADPLRCASPLGVAAMGHSIREWTSDRGGRGIHDTAGVTRGGYDETPVTEHRCAYRRGVVPDTQSRRLGFRCCGGPAPSLSYPTEMERAETFTAEELDLHDVRDILRRLPEVARWADDFRFYTAADTNRALARGDRTRDGMPGYEFADASVVKWFPVHGEEAWIISGRSGADGIIVVAHPLPDGSWAHGASFILSDDDSPLAIAFIRGNPNEVLWSNCMGCGGEGGAVEYRPDEGRILIVQR